MSEQSNVIHVLGLKATFRGYVSEEKRPKFKRYVSSTIVPVFNKFNKVVLNFDQCDEADDDIYMLLSDMLFVLCDELSVSSVEKKLSLKTDSGMIIANIVGYFEFLRTIYKMK